jgi:hypothetical protein
MSWNLRPGQIGVAEDIALSQSRHVAGLRTADLHLFNYRPCVMETLLAAQAAAVGRKASKVLRGV